MSDIGPGDFVECVHSGPLPHQGGSEWPEGEELTEGTVYVVDRLLMSLGEPCATLVGRPRDFSSEFYGCEVGYHVKRFRPIYRRKSEIIERLKAPAPELEPA